MLSNLDNDEVDEIINKFNFSFSEVNENIAKEAAKFRKANYKRELSYIDCIGYALSKSMGFKFLTGDDFFEKMENVEFVK